MIADMFAASEAKKILSQRDDLPLEKLSSSQDLSQQQERVDQDLDANTQSLASAEPSQPPLFSDPMGSETETTDSEAVPIPSEGERNTNAPMVPNGNAIEKKEVPIESRPMEEIDVPATEEITEPAHENDFERTAPVISYHEAPNAFTYPAVSPMDH